MEQLLSKILEKIKKDAYLFRTWEDLLYMCKEAMKTDISLGVRYLKLLSAECERGISDPLTSEQEVKELYGLHKRVLLAAAPYDFDSYLLYVEWNREPKKKFYPPRRKVLKQVVDALQELADDKLDLLAVSLPPGSGKTTLAIFYLTWLGGKIPNEPMLTGSHSNSFVRGVYDECLRIFDAMVITCGTMYSPIYRFLTRTRKIVVSTLISDSVLKHWSLPPSARATRVYIVPPPSSIVTIWCRVSRSRYLRSGLTSCGRPTQRT